MSDELERAPDYPPRVIGIYWTAGEEPVLQADGFADWEVAAVLRELLSQYEGADVEETQEP